MLEIIFIKELLSTLAIALTFIAFIPYVRSIYNSQTRPHVFSWVIWGSVTTVVFFAQLSDKGGAGAWPIGVSAAISIYVAFLAYIKQADNTITRTDWLFLIAAMSSLPLWYFTSEPSVAVVVLTIVDLIGFAPSFRKAYYHPFEENMTFFALIAARNILVLTALEHYSLATALFPAATGIACLLFITLLTCRRRTIKY